MAGIYENPLIFSSQEIGKVGFLTIQAGEGGACISGTKVQRWVRYVDQWVDLRENLQETIDLPMKYGIVLYFFP